MEVQIIDNAISSHGIVAKAEWRLRRNFENVQQKQDQFIGEHLREAVFREK